MSINLSPEREDFEDAVWGREVRSSMVSMANKIETEINDALDHQLNTVTDDFSDTSETSAAQAGAVGGALSEISSALQSNKNNTSYDFNYADSAEGRGYASAVTCDFNWGVINPEDGAETTSHLRVVGEFVPYTKATDFVLWLDTESKYKYSTVYYDSNKQWILNKAWRTASVSISSESSTVPDEGYVRFMVGYAEGTEYISASDVKEINSKIVLLRGKYVPRFLMPAGVNLLDTNIADICESDMDKLPPNKMYGVASGLGEVLAHKPFGGAGGFAVGLSSRVNLSPIVTGNPQLFFGGLNNKMAHRIRWGNEWSDWKSPVYDYADFFTNLNVLVLGDSICKGGRNANKGFIGDIGCPYVNMGIGGATISNVVDSSSTTDTAHFVGAANIPDELVKYNENATAQGWFTPDVIIAEGGINDYGNNAVLGNIPTQPVHDATEDSALDLSTFCGGLQHLFYSMIKYYPSAKRYFLITHMDKTKPWTVHFTGGYTQTELHDATVAICKIYGVEVIDIFNDSFLNSYFSEYVSDTPYRDDHSVTDTEYIDNDGVHPLALGYTEGYVPLVKKALLTALK